MASFKWQVAHYEGWFTIAYGMNDGNYTNLYYILDIIDKKEFRSCISEWENYRWATHEEFKKWSCPPVEEWRKR